MSGLFKLCCGLQRKPPHGLRGEHQRPQALPGPDGKRSLGTDRGESPELQEGRAVEEPLLACKAGDSFSAPDLIDHKTLPQAASSNDSPHTNGAAAAGTVAADDSVPNVKIRNVEPTFLGFVTASASPSATQAVCAEHSELSVITLDAYCAPVQSSLASENLHVSRGTLQACAAFREQSWLTQELQAPATEELTAIDHVHDTQVVRIREGKIYTNVSEQKGRIDVKALQFSRPSEEVAQDFHEPVSDAATVRALRVQNETGDSRGPELGHSSLDGGGQKHECWSLVIEREEDALVGKKPAASKLVIDSSSHRRSATIPQGGIVRAPGHPSNQHARKDKKRPVNNAAVEIPVRDQVLKTELESASPLVTALLLEKDAVAGLLQDYQVSAETNQVHTLTTSSQGSACLQSKDEPINAATRTEQALELGQSKVAGDAEGGEILTVSELAAMLLTAAQVDYNVPGVSPADGDLEAELIIPETYASRLECCAESSYLKDAEIQIENMLLIPQDQENIVFDGVAVGIESTCNKPQSEGGQSVPPTGTMQVEHNGQEYSLGSDNSQAEIEVAVVYKTSEELPASTASYKKKLISQVFIPKDVSTSSALTDTIKVQETTLDSHLVMLSAAAEVEQSEPVHPSERGLQQARSGASDCCLLGHSFKADRSDSGKLLAEGKLVKSLAVPPLAADRSTSAYPSKGCLPLAEVDLAASQDFPVNAQQTVAHDLQHENKHAEMAAQLLELKALSGGGTIKEENNQECTASSQMYAQTEITIQPAYNLPLVATETVIGATLGYHGCSPGYLPAVTLQQVQTVMSDLQHELQSCRSTSSTAEVGRKSGLQRFPSREEQLQIENDLAVHLVTAEPLSAVITLAEGEGNTKEPVACEVVGLPAHITQWEMHRLPSLPEDVEPQAEIKMLSSTTEAVSFEHSPFSEKVEGDGKEQAPSKQAIAKVDAATHIQIGRTMQTACGAGAQLSAAVPLDHPPSKRLTPCEQQVSCQSAILASYQQSDLPAKSEREEKDEAKQHEAEEQPADRRDANQYLKQQSAVQQEAEQESIEQLVIKLQATEQQGVVRQDAEQDSAKQQKAGSLTGNELLTALLIDAIGQSAACPQVQSIILSEEVPAQITTQCHFAEPSLVITQLVYGDQMDLVDAALMECSASAVSFVTSTHERGDNVVAVQSMDMVPVEHTTLELVPPAIVVALSAAVTTGRPQLTEQLESTPGAVPDGVAQCELAVNEESCRGMVQPARNEATLGFSDIEQTEQTTLVIHRADKRQSTESEQSTVLEVEKVGKLPPNVDIIQSCSLSSGVQLHRGGDGFHVADTTNHTAYGTVVFRTNSRQQQGSECQLLPADVVQLRKSQEAMHQLECAVPLSAAHAAQNDLSPRTIHQLDSEPVEMVKCESGPGIADGLGAKQVTTAQTQVSPRVADQLDNGQVNTAQPELCSGTADQLGIEPASTAQPEQRLGTAYQWDIKQVTAAQVPLSPGIADQPDNEQVNMLQPELSIGTTVRLDIGPANTAQPEQSIGTADQLGIEPASTAQPEQRLGTAYQWDIKQVTAAQVPLSPGIADQPDNEQVNMLQPELSIGTTVRLDIGPANTAQPELSPRAADQPDLEQANTLQPELNCGTSDQLDIGPANTAQPGHRLGMAGQRDIKQVITAQVPLSSGIADQLGIEQGNMLQPELSPGTSGQLDIELTNTLQPKQTPGKAHQLYSVYVNTERPEPRPGTPDQPDITGLITELSPQTADGLDSMREHPLADALQLEQFPVVTLQLDGRHQPPEADASQPEKNAKAAPGQKREHTPLTAEAMQPQKCHATAPPLNAECLATPPNDAELPELCRVKAYRIDSEHYPVDTAHLEWSAMTAHQQNTELPSLCLAAARRELSPVKAHQQGSEHQPLPSNALQLQLNPATAVQLDGDHKLLSSDAPQLEPCPVTAVQPDVEHQSLSTDALQLELTPKAIVLLVDALQLEQSPVTAVQLDGEHQPLPSDALQLEQIPVTAHQLDGEHQPLPSDALQLEQSPVTAVQLYGEHQPLPSDALQLEQIPVTAHQLDREHQPLPSDALLLELSPATAHQLDVEHQPLPSDAPQLEPWPVTAVQLDVEPQSLPSDALQLEQSPVTAHQLDREHQNLSSDALQLEQNPVTAHQLDVEHQPLPSDAPQLEPWPVTAVQLDVEPQSLPSDALQLEPCPVTAHQLDREHQNLSSDAPQLLLPNQSSVRAPKLDSEYRPSRMDASQPGQSVEAVPNGNSSSCLQTEPIPIKSHDLDNVFGLSPAAVVALPQHFDVVVQGLCTGYDPLRDVDAVRHEQNLETAPHADSQHEPLRVAALQRELGPPAAPELDGECELLPAVNVVPAELDAVTVILLDKKPKPLAQSTVQLERSLSAACQLDSMNQLSLVSMVECGHSPERAPQPHSENQSLRAETVLHEHTPERTLDRSGELEPLLSTEASWRGQSLLAASHTHLRQVPEIVTMVKLTSQPQAEPCHRITSEEMAIIGTVLIPAVEEEDYVSAVSADQVTEEQCHVVDAPACCSPPGTTRYVLSTQDKVLTAESMPSLVDKGGPTGDLQVFAASTIAHQMECLPRVNIDMVDSIEPNGSFQEYPVGHIKEDEGDLVVFSLQTAKKEEMVTADPSEAVQIAPRGRSADEEACKGLLLHEKGAQESLVQPNVTLTKIVGAESDVTAGRAAQERSTQHTTEESADATGECTIILGTSSLSKRPSAPTSGIKNDCQSQAEHSSQRRMEQIPVTTPAHSSAAVFLARVGTDMTTSEGADQVHQKTADVITVVHAAAALKEVAPQQLNVNNTTCRSETSEEGTPPEKSIAESLAIQQVVTATADIRSVVEKSSSLYSSQAGIGTTAESCLAVNAKKDLSHYVTHAEDAHVLTYNASDESIMADAPDDKRVADMEHLQTLSPPGHHVDVDATKLVVLLAATMADSCATEGVSNFESQKTLDSPVLGTGVAFSELHNAVAPKAVCSTDASRGVTAEEQALVTSTPGCDSRPAVSMKDSMADAMAAAAEVSFIYESSRVGSCKASTDTQISCQSLPATSVADVEGLQDAVNVEPNIKWEQSSVREVMSISVFCWTSDDDETQSVDSLVLDEDGQACFTARRTVPRSSASPSEASCDCSNNQAPSEGNDSLVQMPTTGLEGASEETEQVLIDTMEYSSLSATESRAVDCRSYDVTSHGNIEADVPLTDAKAELLSISVDTSTVDEPEDDEVNVNEWEESECEGYIAADGTVVYTRIIKKLVHEDVHISSTRSRHPSSPALSAKTPEAEVSLHFGCDDTSETEDTCRAPARLSQQALNTSEADYEEIRPDGSFVRRHVTVTVVEAENSSFQNGAKQNQLQQTLDGDSKETPAGAQPLTVRPPGISSNLTNVTESTLFEDDGPNGEHWNSSIARLTADAVENDPCEYDTSKSDCDRLICHSADSRGLGNPEATDQPWEDCMLSFQQTAKSPGLSYDDSCGQASHSQHPYPDIDPAHRIISSSSFQGPNGQHFCERSLYFTRQLSAVEELSETDSIDRFESESISSRLKPPWTKASTWDDSFVADDTTARSDHPAESETQSTVIQLILGNVMGTSCVAANDTDSEVENYALSPACTNVSSADLIDLGRSKCNLIQLNEACESEEERRSLALLPGFPIMASHGYPSATGSEVPDDSGAISSSLREFEFLEKAFDTEPCAKTV